MNMKIIYIVLIVIGVILLWWLYRRNFKQLKCPSVCLITGGVKTGKTLLTSCLAIRDYKSRMFKYRIHKFFHKKSTKEMPLFYTNSFICFGKGKSVFNKETGMYENVIVRKHKYDQNIRYLSTSDLLREHRFNYGSVIFIQECSLLADNMDYNDKERNVDLSLFQKLIAHETRGGCIYYDTQSILDSHYSIKRVTSTYFFIQKNYNCFLFHLLYVREMINQENGVNNFIDDVDTTTRKVLIPFWYHWKYNRYEYSYLTDKLDKSDKPYDDKNKSLVSFNPLYIARSMKSNVGKEEIK